MIRLLIVAGYVAVNVGFVYFCGFIVYTINRKKGVS